MRIGALTYFDGNQKGDLTDFVIGAGKALEDRGFASIWTPEHVVTFPKYDPAYPYPYGDNGVPPADFSKIGLLDPITVLTTLATHTSTLRLGTGIAIIPQRNPAYFAKMATGIDLLSKGRFVAGMGLGWSGQEYAATMTPFEHRGARMREYIQVIRTLWCDDLSKFDGAYYSLPECIQLPKPICKPHPPFYFGGESDAAMRRVVEFGQGWMPWGLSPKDLEPRVVKLEKMLIENRRTLADVDVVVSPGMDDGTELLFERSGLKAPPVVDMEMLERYADLGVSEVVFVCMAESLDSFCAKADKLTRRFVVPAGRL